jgi:hypothetical protein
MQKFFFILCTFIVSSFLTGCAGQPAGAKSLEEYRMPTDVPTNPELTATVQAEVVASTPPKNCPVTLPQEPLFTPPAPYSKLGWYGDFWYGSNALWVALPQNGVWSGLPHNSEGYTQKIPWWREDYSWTEEPEPPLVVSGERLDAKAPPLNASTANGSYATDMGSAMMMGVDFPTLGCWKVTGRYKDAELSFVVWVAP